MSNSLDLDQDQVRPKVFCKGYQQITKGYVLLRREISLKVICEKVKFSNCDFYNNICDYE